MKDLQQIKAIAEQMFSLSADLLRLIDMDEQARRALIEEVKKMLPGKCYTSPA